MKLNQWTRHALDRCGSNTVEGIHKWIPNTVVICSYLDLIQDSDKIHNSDKLGAARI